MTLTEQFIDLTEDEVLALEAYDDWSYPPELEVCDLSDIGVSMINLDDDYEGF